MPGYPALIDGEKGAYGLTFPDLPGIVAMGETLDEAIANGKEALRDYAIEAHSDGEDIITPTPLEKVETPDGQRLVTIPLLLPDGTEVRAR